MKSTASKLEAEMDRRENAAKASLEANRKANEAREKKAERQARVFERKEFNRLFSRLKTLVDGAWDRNGWGWKFHYKDDDYFIAYEHWYSPKEPGDADGYDMSGVSWVLKRGFNASDKWKVTLSSEDQPKPLTEAVLRGLRELNRGS